MGDKFITPTIRLGESVRIDLRRLVCINIDNPLWKVSQYETPKSLCDLPYKSIRIPVWNLVTLEIYDELGWVIYDELYRNTKSPI